jgi:hypothetical protein
MKFSAFLLAVILFASCKDSDREEITTSENNIDAARNFIRSALDGKFNDARRFMIRDSVNLNYIDVVERSFSNLDQATRDGYRTSSIRILEKKDINDSTAVVIYANTFKNDPDTLKVMRIGGEWLVDLKFLYLHDFDTLIHKPVTDTLPVTN